MNVLPKSAIKVLELQTVALSSIGIENDSTPKTTSKTSPTGLFSRFRKSEKKIRELNRSLISGNDCIQLM